MDPSFSSCRYIDTGSESFILPLWVMRRINANGGAIRAHKALSPFLPAA